MKYPIAIIALAFALNSQAQTVVVTTNTVVTTDVVTASTNTVTSPVGLGQLGTDFLKFLQDSEPFYTNSFRTAVGGVKIDKRWGGLIDIDIPIAVNGQLGLGFAGLWLANPSTLYSGSVNLEAGTTWSLLGQKVNTWVASGPGYNNAKREIILYSATGASWNTHLGSGQLTLSGGGVNISDVPGIGYFGAISYGWTL